MGKQTYPTNELIYVRTPLIESVPLRKFAAGRKVFLKLENCQPSGSFKMRGISALCKYVRPLPCLPDLNLRAAFP